LIEEVGGVHAEVKELKVREIDTQAKRINELRERLEKIYEAAGVSEEDQTGFFRVNTEEEMSYADSRSQILSLLLRTRFLLSRVFKRQGLLLNSFYVLRQGL
jgi:hypothetical protein